MQNDLDRERGDRYDLSDVLHGRSLVIASNRGPIVYEKTDNGELVPRRGAGGLVTALTHVMRQASGLWVASAMGTGDREMVKRQHDEHLEAPFDDDRLHLRYLTFDRDVFERYYNRISNSVFWFLQHNMWNLPMHPRFTAATREAWMSYHAVNQRFAEALAEEIAGTEKTAPVMLHDYHLMLVARYLRKLVPDAFSYHFTHSPWSQPDMWRVLPGRMAEDTLEGMLANDLLGFQSARWARNFIQCCEDILSAEVDHNEGLVRYMGTETTVRHYPISIEVESVRKLAHSDEAARHLAWLDRMLDGRRLILRIDRLELSKNIVRGFRAYEEMLKANPQWIGKVVHLALVYPSRRALSEYRTYEAEVLEVHDRINEELGTDDWQPIVLINEDNYIRALACSRRYDVLIVNPIADGMNLVAKEGPAVNEVDGVLILSTNAGAWFELGHGAIGVNPYDVAEMAEAMHTALSMDASERADLGSFLRQVIEKNTPSKWVWYQLNDIRRLHEA
ncbi:MAG: trehalose-6-phosphate synthase [Actinomycetota bacterium]|nr:trehalose-6-phosphate synthase [Actinomycetota bacterium]